MPVFLINISLIIFTLTTPYKIIDDKFCIYEIETNQNCKPNPNFSYSTDQDDLDKFKELVVPVVFWNINRDDGSHDNPLSIEKIRESMHLLNHAYNGMNICFEFEDFKSINDSKIYWTDYYKFNKHIKSNYASNKDVLNVYVPYRFTNFKNNLRGGKWSENQLSVNMLNYNTGILPHEVGHIFGLSHTHYGSKASNCERVTRDENDPNYNAKCTGDRVTDTNAMPILYGKFHLIDENCNYIGKLKDCEGTPYQLTKLDIRNFMGYTQHTCRSRFTIGQGIRAREFIERYQNMGKFKFVKYVE